MMTFNELVRKNNLKIKRQIIQKTRSIEEDRTRFKSGNLFERWGFLTSYGIVNLHPSRGTHWVLYIKDCYFDSYGCPPPKKLLNYLKNKYKKSIYSEYQIQRNDSFCTSYCLYIL